MNSGADRAFAKLLREHADKLEEEVRQIRRRADKLHPRCGKWTDGHSYNTCRLPSEHEGRCDPNAP